MTITEKYRDFILENIIGDKLLVQLPKPYENGKIMWVKLGVVVYMEVELEVIEKYSRSIKFKLKFDKYEIEQLFFTPVESAPYSIKEKLYNKVEKLVYTAFFEDNRRDDILKMYEDKQKMIFGKFSAKNENK